MSFLRRAVDIRKDFSNSQGEVKESRNVDQLLATVENIYHIRDLDTLLERILFEAHSFVRADAGTLYLEAKGRLYFNYVQNDSLSINETSEQRHVFASQSLPVDKTSLAGYVAVSGEPILVDDVYDIQSNVSFSFNPAFDKQASYRTQSMLIVPLLTRTKITLGVLQLINAQSPSGEVVPFSGQDRLYIMQFAQHAANAIERAKLNREMVLRMVEISELRDPYETGQHAKRVSTYSTEIFSLWAERRDFSTSLMRATKEALMPAAMLHDVGKVAVSDVILKKPALLTNDEQILMKLHTVYGARLFKNLDSHWDRVAHEVVLNHHERWDGKGYPGKMANINEDPVQFGPGKSGEDIPVTARIVTIADVFDALISDWAYKDAWDEPSVLEYIEKQAGKQFDPEIVEIFLEMQPVIRSIRERYSY